MVEKKLRLLLFEDCDRSCQGCCNNDWDLSTLETEEDFRNYSFIMLTGGEPMLHPSVVKSTVKYIRQQTDVPIVLYTAKCDEPIKLFGLLDILDGITLTLHTQKDVEPFMYFNKIVQGLAPLSAVKSLRLNVFKGINLSGLDLVYWKGKTNIEWIKNCPLPKDEVFKRI